MADANNV